MKATETPIPTQAESFRYFKRLLVLVRPYWGRLGQGLMLSLLLGSIGMVTPLLSKVFIDNVYPTGNLTLMHVLVLATVVISLASALMSGLRGYFSQAVTATMMRATSLMFFNHIQHLPIRFFDEHRSGEVLSRFSDMRTALARAASVVQTLVVSGAYVLLVPPILFFLNWKLAALALISLPLTTGLGFASGRVMRRYTKKAAEVGSELSAFQYEVLSHIRTLKTMAAEHHVYRRAAEQAGDGLRLQMTTSGIGTLVGFAGGLIRVFCGAIYAWYSWTLILTGELSLGSFIAFSAYLGYLTGPVGQFAGLFVGFQQTAVTLGRAFEYLDMVPEQDPMTALKPPPIIRRIARGELTFRNVTFGYRSDRPVLANVSLTIPAGSVTSIVGRSGAGKSSLLRLVCRTDDPDSGDVLLDGIALPVYALPEIRRQVAVVWQEFSLMRGTVWHNLTFGAENPSRVDVERAVDICQLGDFVRELPDGFDTPVAEWGATLSGGQRQRLAIARAVARRAPVLLLDEATSQLDVETEERLLRDLVDGVRGTTIIMVTHRIATASLAQQIVVLEDGKLAGVGPHVQLVDECEGYRRVYSMSARTDDQRHLRVLSGQ